MAQLELVARTALTLIFLASLSSKIISPKAFAAFTKAVQVLGGRRMHVAPIWAAVVIGAEALCVVLLVLPGRRNLDPLAFALPASLLLVFTAALVTAMRRGVRQPCRCFGSSTRAPDGVTVARNLGLLVTCAIGALCSMAPPAPATSRTSAAALAGGLLLAVAFMSCETIADLWRPPMSSSGVRPKVRA